MLAAEAAGVVTCMDGTVVRIKTIEVLYAGCLKVVSGHEGSFCNHLKEFLDSPYNHCHYWIEEV